MGLTVLASAAGAAVAPNEPAWPMRPERWALDGALLLGADLLPGGAAWLVWRRVDVGLHRKRSALRLWGWSLPARAVWAASMALPFAGHGAGAAAALGLLGGLTLLCIRAFWPLHRFAAAMLLPYMACIGLAAWLGAGV